MVGRDLCLLQVKDLYCVKFIDHRATFSGRRSHGNRIRSDDSD